MANLIFQFTDEYTPPWGDSIKFEFFPVPWAAEEIAVEKSTQVFASGSVVNCLLTEPSFRVSFVTDEFNDNVGVGLQIRVMDPDDVVLWDKMIMFADYNPGLGVHVYITDEEFKNWPKYDGDAATRNRMDNRYKYVQFDWDLDNIGLDKFKRKNPLSVSYFCEARIIVQKLDLSFTYTNWALCHFAMFNETWDLTQLRIWDDTAGPAISSLTPNMEAFYAVTMPPILGYSPNLTSYRIQVSDNDAFAGELMWDSDTISSDTSPNSVTPATIYGASNLARDGSTYYFRFRGIADTGTGIYGWGEEVIEWTVPIQFNMLLEVWELVHLAICESEVVQTALTEHYPTFRAAFTSNYLLARADKVRIQVIDRNIYPTGWSGLKWDSGVIDIDRPIPPWDDDNQQKSPPISYVMLPGDEGFFWDGKNFEFRIMLEINSNDEARGVAEWKSMAWTMDTAQIGASEPQIDGMTNYPDVKSFTPYITARFDQDEDRLPDHKPVVTHQQVQIFSASMGVVWDSGERGIDPIDIEIYPGDRPTGVMVPYYDSGWNRILIPDEDYYFQIRFRNERGILGDWSLIDQITGVGKFRCVGWTISTSSQTDILYTTIDPITRYEWYADITHITGNNVDHLGEHYTCISNHESALVTEPGVGADWTDVWKVGTSKVYYEIRVESKDEVCVYYLTDMSGMSQPIPVINGLAINAGSLPRLLFDEATGVITMMFAINTRLFLRQWNITDTANEIEIGSTASPQLIDCNYAAIGLTDSGVNDLEISHLPYPPPMPLLIEGDHYRNGFLMATRYMIRVYPKTRVHPDYDPSGLTYSLFTQYYKENKQYGTPSLVLHEIQDVYSDVLGINISNSERKWVPETNPNEPEIMESDRIRVDIWDPAIEDNSITPRILTNCDESISNLFPFHPDRETWSWFRNYFPYWKEITRLEDTQFSGINAPPNRNIPSFYVRNYCFDKAITRVEDDFFAGLYSGLFGQVTEFRNYQGGTLR